MLILTHQQKTAFENIVGKGEIAPRNDQFLLFPQFFLLNQINVSPFVHIFDIISLFAAEFEKPKIGKSGKGLNKEKKKKTKIKILEPKTKQRNFRLVQIKCICR